MKLKVTRLVALMLALLLLSVALYGCKSGDDEIPEHMQHATIAGSDYRLYLPIDWNLLTDTGVSGGYASMQNKAVIYVKVYDNPEGLTAAAYWSTVLAPALLETFDADTQSNTQMMPIETTLNEHAAILIGYEGTREMVTYQGQDIICPKDDKMYVLSFCARKDLYEGYLTVFDEVKKNFKFSDTPFEPKDPINTVDPDAEAPEGMQLASNDDVAYRFYVPKSWVLDKNLPTSSAYVSESDRSNVNVTVYMPEVDHIESVDDYWATCLEELKKGMSIEGAITDSETTVDGCKAKTYEYTANIEGHLFRFAQTITSYRGMIYTITYTASIDNYKAHRDAYSDILAAFDFRGN